MSIAIVDVRNVLNQVILFHMTRYGFSVDLAHRLRVLAARRLATNTVLGRQDNAGMS